MRQSRLKIGGIAVGAAAVLLSSACGSSNTPSSSQAALASSQVLHFPVYADPKTFDPGKVTHEADSELIQNVFNNLWKFDSSLNVVPDIASDVPTPSSDGLTYMVHLKQNVTFSNGDKVTAKDVLYSWNRGTDLVGGYASNFSAIDGFDAAQAAVKAAVKANPSQTRPQIVEAGLAASNPAFQMTGLTAPDGPTGYTVQIKLSTACGWCLQAWALEGTVGAIVDENVIKNDPTLWWQKPGELIGTGPYTLSAFTSKQSEVFKAVANWWGSPKPTITEVDIDIKDPSTAPTTVAAWEQNSYDIIGYGGYSSIVQISDILRIKANSTEGPQLQSIAKGRTSWVSFNQGWTTALGGAGGPFLGNSQNAINLRLAFDLAVDKNGLASTVCHNLACHAATAGLITPGLAGNLGQGNDPLAKFDPAKAKQLLQQADPTGSLTGNLKYSYNTGFPNDQVASYLQGQWQQNLGIHVNLDPDSDGNDFIGKRLTGTYVMSRDGWQFDYNHPQDWYDNLWGKFATDEQNNTSGFDDPQYDQIATQARGLPIAQALPLYKQLSDILVKDAIYIPLYYSVGTFLIHNYVKGAGSNLAFDNYWQNIQILQH